MPEPADERKKPLGEAGGAAPLGPDTYELEERDEPAEEPEPVPPVLPAPAPRPASDARPPKAKRPKLEQIDPAEAVPEVWSRWKEWGPTLLILAKVGLGALVVLVLLVWIGLYSLAFLLLLITAGALVVLSYPMIITLERPVRFTPEQAVNDYYAAVSHHLPHYRRMWLLLAAEGRSSEEFSTIEEFRAAWEGAIDRLSGDSERRFNPLVFKVSGFQSDKGAGATAVRASFTVEVVRRGEAASGPMQSSRVETILVRGPDKMWYLTEGRPPGPRD